MATTDLTPELNAACERFDAAFAEWLGARADLAARHEDGSEQAERRRAQREETAELALVATPAPHSTALWQKWSLLEHLMAVEAEDGPSAYPMLLVALASVKADILALGLNAWPDHTEP